MSSPLPHLPRNPLGDAPRNPLGRPPAIGSRSGGRRHRLRSPLPSLTRRPSAPPPSATRAPAPQRQPARIIHIHEHREGRQTPPQPPQAAAPPPPVTSAATRREALHGLLREPDADYVRRMPAEHQERFRVILREHGHDVAQGHSRAGLQYLDDVRRRQRGLPTREVPPRARARVNSERVRAALRRRAAHAAEETPTPPTPEQQAHRAARWRDIETLARDLRDEPLSGE